MKKTYVKVISARWQALHIGGVGGVEGHGVAFTPDLIHQVPGHDGVVILVQSVGVCVLQIQLSKCRDD